MRDTAPRGPAGFWGEAPPALQGLGGSSSPQLCIPPGLGESQDTLIPVMISGVLASAAPWFPAWPRGHGGASLLSLGGALGFGVMAWPPEVGWSSLV